MTPSRQTLPVVERVDRSGLAQLGLEWDHLLSVSATPSPSMVWPWIGAWLDTAASNTELRVITARDPSDGSLVGVAPFAIARTRRYGIAYRALRFITTGALGGRRLDMLVHRDRATVVANVLWDAVGADRRWDVIDLSGLAGDGALAGLLLRRRGDGYGSGRLQTREIDLTTALGVVGEDARHTQDIHLVVTADGVDATLDAATRMTESLDASNARRAPITHPAVSGFYRHAAHRLLDAGRLRMWRLDHKGRPLVILYGARFDGQVVGHALLVDPNRASPLHADRLITTAAVAAADEGARRLTLPPTNTPLRLPTHTRHDVWVRRPVGPLGRLLMTGSYLRRAEPLRRMRARPESPR